MRASRRQPGKKPSVSASAEERMRRFLEDLDTLQFKYDIRIASDEGNIVLRDKRRRDDWDGYGDWDGHVHNGRGSLSKRLWIEDFSGWGE